MEWTREKTLALIGEYRKRRGLWDMTHDDYRKKEVKQKLLAEVSNCIGSNIPIVEIEKKFHTLRTQYHREINRMKRKEPYNSKWFGFKTLQFLSSPKACRSNKGRIKSEITEEGTVTKFIIREAPHNNSAGSANSSSNITEEFITIQRKPTIYDVSSTGPATVSASTSGAHELEKLIEETTKDVEDIEDAKPKMGINEITVPLEHHNYTTQILNTHSSEGNDVISNGTVQESIHEHSNHQHHHDQQQMEEDEEDITTIDIQGAEDEISYQTSSNNNTVNSHSQTSNVHHTIPAIPTRIIKIQRRDTCQEEDYYEDEQHNAPKRIYYDANGHHHSATILTSTPQTSSNSRILNSVVKQHMQQSNVSVQQSPISLNSPPTIRDEFTTYGEYVGNEMRGITNREKMNCEPNLSLPQEIDLDALRQSRDESYENELKLKKQKPYKHDYFEVLSGYEVLPVFSHREYGYDKALSLKENEYLNIKWNEFLGNVPKKCFALRLYRDYNEVSPLVRKMQLSGKFYTLDNKLAPIPIIADPRL